MTVSIYDLIDEETVKAYVLKTDSFHEAVHNLTDLAIKAYQRVHEDIPETLEKQVLGRFLSLLKGKLDYEPIQIYYEKRIRQSGSTIDEDTLMNHIESYCPRTWVNDEKQLARKLLAHYRQNGPRIERDREISRILASFKNHREHYLKTYANPLEAERAFRDDLEDALKNKASKEEYRPWVDHMVRMLHKTANELRIPYPEAPRAVEKHSKVHEVENKDPSDRASHMDKARKEVQSHIEEGGPKNDEPDPVIGGIPNLPEPSTEDLNTAIIRDISVLDSGKERLLLVYLFENEDVADSYMYGREEISEDDVRLVYAKHFTADANSTALMIEQEKIDAFVKETSCENYLMACATVNLQDVKMLSTLETSNQLIWIQNNLDRYRLDGRKISEEELHLEVVLSLPKKIAQKDTGLQVTIAVAGPLVEQLIATDQLSALSFNFSLTNHKKTYFCLEDYTTISEQRFTFTVPLDDRITKIVGLEEQLEARAHVRYGDSIKVSEPLPLVIVSKDGEGSGRVRFILDSKGPYIQGDIVQYHIKTDEVEKSILNTGVYNLVFTTADGSEFKYIGGDTSSWLKLKDGKASFIIGDKLFDFVSSYLHDVTTTFSVELRYFWEADGKTRSMSSGQQKFDIVDLDKTSLDFSIDSKFQQGGKYLIGQEFAGDVAFDDVLDAIISGKDVEVAPVFDIAGNNEVTELAGTFNEAFAKTLDAPITCFARMIIPSDTIKDGIIKDSEKIEFQLTAPSFTVVSVNDTDIHDLPQLKDKGNSIVLSFGKLYDEFIEPYSVSLLLDGKNIPCKQEIHGKGSGSNEMLVHFDGKGDKLTIQLNFGSVAIAKTQIDIIDTNPTGKQHYTLEVLQIGDAPVNEHVADVDLMGAADDVTILLKSSIPTGTNVQIKTSVIDEDGQAQSIIENGRPFVEGAIEKAEFPIMLQKARDIIMNGTRLHIDILEAGSVIANDDVKLLRGEPEAIEGELMPKDAEDQPTQEPIGQIGRELPPMPTKQMQLPLRQSYPSKFDARELTPDRPVAEHDFPKHLLPRLQEPQALVIFGSNDAQRDKQDNIALDGESRQQLKIVYVGAQVGQKIILLIRGPQGEERIVREAVQSQGRLIVTLDESKLSDGSIVIAELEGTQIRDQVSIGVPAEALYATLITRREKKWLKDCAWVEFVVQLHMSDQMFRRLKMGDYQCGLGIADRSEQQVISFDFKTIDRTVVWRLATEALWPIIEPYLRGGANGRFLGRVLLRKGDKYIDVRLDQSREIILTEDIIAHRPTPRLEDQSLLHAEQELLNTVKYFVSIDKELALFLQHLLDREPANITDKKNYWKDVMSTVKLPEELHKFVLDHSDKYGTLMKHMEARRVELPKRIEAFLKELNKYPTTHDVQQDYKEFSQESRDQIRSVIMRYNGYIRLQIGFLKSIKSILREENGMIDYTKITHYFEKHIASIDSLYELVNDKRPIDEKVKDLRSHMEAAINFTKLFEDQITLYISAVTKNSKRREELIADLNSAMQSSITNLRNELSRLSQETLEDDRNYYDELRRIETHLSEIPRGQIQEEPFKTFIADIRQLDAVFKEHAKQIGDIDAEVRRIQETS